MDRKGNSAENTHMHGGGPSPSGSNFRHSYGLAAVSNAHTSAKGRFPESKIQCYIPKVLTKSNATNDYFACDDMCSCIKRKQLYHHFHRSLTKIFGPLKPSHDHIVVQGQVLEQPPFNHE